MARLASGDLVLFANLPHEALTLVSIDDRGMAHVTRDDCDSWCLVAKLIACPPGWEDAPQPPAGCAQPGLSEAERRVKTAHDDRDPEYLRALIRWCRARARWADQWLRPIDPVLADKEIAGAALIIEYRTAMLRAVQQKEAA